MNDEDEFEECVICSEEHPVGVLEDGHCPNCVDLEEDMLTLKKKREIFR